MRTFFSSLPVLTLTLFTPKEANMAKTATRPATTPPAEKLAERSKNMPVFTTRHRALKAAVWLNETDNGPMFNTTVTRSYKDGETWKESDSFGYDDVLIVAELLRTCHGFISREMAKVSTTTKE
jgi:hypothetical protein